jgi:hypothetical protein
MFEVRHSSNKYLEHNLQLGKHGHFIWQATSSAKVFILFRLCYQVKQSRMSASWRHWCSRQTPACIGYKTVIWQHANRGSSSKTQGGVNGNPLTMACNMVSLFLNFARFWWVLNCDSMLSGSMDIGTMVQWGSLPCLVLKFQRGLLLSSHRPNLTVNIIPFVNISS